MRIRKSTEKTRGGINPAPVPERGNNMYTDIETGEHVTTEQLYTEYLHMKQEQPEEYSYSFPEYIQNCLTENNGTLERG